MGDIDPLLVAGDQESPPDHQTKGALDDSAARQDFQAFLVVAPADDLHNEVGIAGLAHELEPVVSTIGEEMRHPGPALADTIEDCLGARLKGNDDVSRLTVMHCAVRLCDAV